MERKLFSVYCNCDTTFIPFLAVCEFKFEFECVRVSEFTKQCMQIKTRAWSIISNYLQMFTEHVFCNLTSSRTNQAIPPGSYASRQLSHAQNVHSFSVLFTFFSLPFLATLPFQTVQWAPHTQKMTPKRYKPTEHLNSFTISVWM